MKFQASLLSSELPLNDGPIAVCAPIPGFGLTAQLADFSEPASSQALAAEKTDLYFGLIQPASMGGCVVQRKSIPQPSAILFPKAVRQRLAGVGAQVVDDEMNGVGGRIVGSDLQDEIGKLGRRPCRRHFGEMNSRLGFDAAENIGRSTAPVLIISSGDLARLHGHHRPRIFMQNHRFFVHANHRFAFR